eukprot:Nk52_evm9s2579 gene=Nk52_evmTU9s2579
MPVICSPADPQPVHQPVEEVEDIDADVEMEELRNAIPLETSCSGQEAIFQWIIEYATMRSMEHSMEVNAATVAFWDNIIKACAPSLKLDQCGSGVKMALNIKPLYDCVLKYNPKNKCNWSEVSPDAVLCDFLVMKEEFMTLDSKLRVELPRGVKTQFFAILSHIKTICLTIFIESCLPLDTEEAKLEFKRHVNAFLESEFHYFHEADVKDSAYEGETATEVKMKARIEGAHVKHFKGVVEELLAKRGRMQGAHQIGLWQISKNDSRSNYVVFAKKVTHYLNNIRREIFDEPFLSKAVRECDGYVKKIGSSAPVQDPKVEDVKEDKKEAEKPVARQVFKPLCKQFNSSVLKSVFLKSKTGDEEKWRQLEENPQLHEEALARIMMWNVDMNPEVVKESEENPKNEGNGKNAEATETDFAFRGVPESSKGKEKEKEVPAPVEHDLPSYSVPDVGNMFEEGRLGDDHSDSGSYVDSSRKTSKRPSSSDRKANSNSPCEPSTSKTKHRKVEDATSKTSCDLDESTRLLVKKMNEVRKELKERGIDPLDEVDFSDVKKAKSRRQDKRESNSGRGRQKSPSDDSDDEFRPKKSKTSAPARSGKPITSKSTPRAAPRKKGERQKRRVWTEDEIRNLALGLKDFGVGDWQEIKKTYEFNNRSTVDLKDKYRNLMKHMTLEELIKHYER